MFLYYYKNKMWKVIWTTVVRLIIVALFWFYLKFIDNGLAGQVSGWLMNQEQVTMSGEIQDPVLSWIMNVETKIDMMSGLNIQVEENAKLLKQISEKLGISTANVEVTSGSSVTASTGTVNVSTGTKGN